MNDAFLTKVKRASLPEEIVAFYTSHGSTSSVTARSDIVGCAEETQCIHILMAGWACHYRISQDGSRQIAIFCLPGDICNIEHVYNKSPIVGVAALSPCRVRSIPLEAVREAIEADQRIREFFWSLTLDRNDRLLERLLNVGRRSSQSVAYFFADILARLQAAGLADDGVFPARFTQADVADSLGLSVVHVNRLLQELKREGLIASRGQSYVILDEEALRAAAT